MSAICNKCGRYRAQYDIESDGVCRQCKGKKSYAILEKEQRPTTKKKKWWER